MMSRRSPVVALALATMALVASLVAAVAAPGSAELVVVRVYYDDAHPIASLSDYDLLEYRNREQGYVLALVDPDEHAALLALGFRVAVDEVATADVRGVHARYTGERAGIPGFACYRTVEETYELGQRIATDVPTLASWIDVGDSWEKQQGLGGHDLFVLRLTNAAIPGPKPKLFITSSIHAREYTPAELSSRFAEYLSKNYGRNADVTWLLDWHEVHLMLQANPDGRKQAETGLLWRKNTDRNYCGPTSNNRGADLNRNYAFEWNCCGGSSGSQCSETYRGAGPASEPEIQTIQAYIASQFADRRPDALSTPAPLDTSGIVLDTHSYTGLVLWPWGFDLPTGNAAELGRLGRRLAWFNDYVPEQAVDLYVTDGTSLDYSYGQLGLAAFTFELGTAFFQDCLTFESQILPDNMAAYLYAAKVARAPYVLPAGPEALALAVAPRQVAEGLPVTLTATLDDTRSSPIGNSEGSQAIVEAEYYVDVPPWDAAHDPAARVMNAADGGFNTTVEAVTASVATTGLAAGRHILFVRGRDAGGNWGPVSAAFVDLSPQDDDGDGVGNGLDCAPANAGLWDVPSAARNLLLSRVPGNELSWDAPETPGSIATLYDVLRSALPDDFAGATCVASGLTLTSAGEPAVPPEGALSAYLVRARNGCGGNLGVDSTGLPRVGPSCP